jgi:hypothetical protein
VVVLVGVVGFVVVVVVVVDVGVDVLPPPAAGAEEPVPAAVRVAVSAAPPLCCAPFALAAIACTGDVGDCV